MSPFDKCRELFSDRSVLLVGNGPSARDLKSLARSYDRVATVNAGLFMLNEEGIRADLLWIQDGRMLIEKKDRFLPYLDKEIIFCLSQHAVTPIRMNPSNFLRFQHLGNIGFSLDPRIGIFTGYSALYGLTQLAAWCRPQKVGIVGMDLDYGRNTPRAYQTKRGFDVDLHVNDKQISCALQAASILESRGIEVEICRKSNLLARSVTPQSRICS